MADEIDSEVTKDVGGVQGTDDIDTGPESDGPNPTITGDTPEEPAPDAGEIEWAGGLVKKPPAPQN